jgi:hypothetical protein
MFDSRLKNLRFALLFEQLLELTSASFGQLTLRSKQHCFSL